MNTNINNKIHVCILFSFLYYRDILIIIIGHCFTFEPNLKKRHKEKLIVIR